MKIFYEEKTLEAEPGETALDCLLRHGIDVENSCRSGVCQSCIKVAVAGSIDARAQQALSATQKRDNYILSCQQKVNDGLSLRGGVFARTVEAEVTRVDSISSDVILVRAALSEELAFEAGQFVHVIRPADDVFRAYSIANLPGDSAIELHVRVYPDGALSPFLAAAQGQTIKIRGPFGGCCYEPAEPDVPLILAGTGTGAAPLLAVMKQAIFAQHRGPIFAVFGARDDAGLYMKAMAEQLSESSDTVTVSFSTLAEGQVPIFDQLRARVKELKAHSAGSPRVNLCGDPGIVQKMKRNTYLDGIGLDRIFSDPFAPPAS